MGKRIKVPEVVTVDFETYGIKKRPEYPPIPVGYSVLAPDGRKCEYHSWGHPVGNNTTKSQAVRRLKDIARGKLPMLFHNGKFDVDVMETHCDIPRVPWEMIHDTLFLIFLTDPHAKNMSLKPTAERLLGMKPEEQDAVRDWVLAHKREIEAKYGTTFKPSEWGAYICEAPGDLVGKYAKGDVIRTYKLFKLLYPQIVELDMLPAYDRKRQIMPILMENEREGLRVDRLALERDIDVYSKCMTKADNWLRKQLKAPGLNIDSDADFAKALKAAGVVENFVQTPTGKDSVSKKNMTADMFSDKKIYLTFGYRNRLATCLRMFMEPWLAISATTGNIHPTWNQVRQSHDSGNQGNFGTRTGRLSCRDPNLLNLSKDWYDKGDGYSHPKGVRDLLELPLVRRYILPDKGGLFCHRDYSQQELRMLAHFEDDKLAEAYNADPKMDVHKFVRSMIHQLTGVDYERRAVKILNFGMIYGMGVGKLAEAIGCTVDSARNLKKAQLRAIPGLKALNDEIKAIAKDGGYVRTWGGRIYYPEPPMIINGRLIDFIYKLLNYLIQGSSADFTEQAIINYHHAKRDGRFLVTVYDEINISAPKKAAKHEMAILRECMETAENMRLDVPMLSDGDTGPNWADLTKFKEA